ncbi:MlrC C-terminal domain-containing protein [Kozakia baliensis]|uniref:MlrC C-terminal domain-containing protein n=1 Tax=Kozakia baliensis TaxID=153496 RepID=UPI001D05A752
MASRTYPLVISDSRDNPGEGGNSDQTFFLQALLKAGAKDVLLGGGRTALRQTHVIRRAWEPYSHFPLVPRLTRSATALSRCRSIRDIGG